GLVIVLPTIFGVINITKNITVGKLSLKYTSFIYAIDSKGQEYEYETLKGSENRVWVDITEIPPNLQNAVVSIEDERFYKHPGFDLKSTSKAAFDYILRRPGGRGASTLTQQLIKNVTGDNEVKAGRKVKEILQALQLERRMSKEQILEMYLNTIYLSQGCNGVKTASLLYFGKDVSRLSLDECALIAGITQYPSKYDPFRHYDAAVEKRDMVLQKMFQLGYITEKEYKDAKNTKTKLASKNKDANVQSYYADQVITDVMNDLQEKNGYSESAAAKLLYSGGLKIYACVDPDIQGIADEVYANDKNFPKL
ncbi:transglycosylase domain-containing protein, partial [Treponema sp. R6D11]